MRSGRSQQNVDFIAPLEVCSVKETYRHISDWERRAASRANSPGNGPLRLTSKKKKKTCRKEFSATPQMVSSSLRVRVLLLVFRSRRSHALRCGAVRMRVQRKNNNAIWERHREPRSPLGTPGSELVSVHALDKCRLGEGGSRAQESGDVFVEGPI